jgi:hypothetical protein
LACYVCRTRWGEEGGDVDKERWELVLYGVKVGTLLDSAFYSISDGIDYTSLTLSNDDHGVQLKLNDIKPLGVKSIKTCEGGKYQGFVLGDGHVSVKNSKADCYFPLSAQDQLAPGKESECSVETPLPPPPPPTLLLMLRVQLRGKILPLPLPKIPKDRKPLTRLFLLAHQILHLLTSILIVLVMSLLFQTLVVLALDRVDVMIVYKTSAPVNIVLPLGIAYSSFKPSELHIKQRDLEGLSHLLDADPETASNEDMAKLNKIRKDISGLSQAKFEETVERNGLRPLEYIAGRGMPKFKDGRCVFRHWPEWISSKCSS